MKHTLSRAVLLLLSLPKALHLLIIGTLQMNRPDGVSGRSSEAARCFQRTNAEVELLGHKYSFIIYITCHFNLMIMRHGLFSGIHFKKKLITITCNKENKHTDYVFRRSWRLKMNSWLRNVISVSTVPSSSTSVLIIHLLTDAGGGLYRWSTWQRNMWITADQPQCSNL